MVAFIHKEKPHSARQDQAFRWLDSFVALHVTGAVKLVDDAGIHRGVGLRVRRRFFLKQACDFRSKLVPCDYSAAIIRSSCSADRIGSPSIDLEGLPSMPTSGLPTNVIR